MTKSGKNGGEIGFFIFMDGDYDFWVDLLAESCQILFGGMTGCVKVFFDKASSFPELFYKVIQLLVKSCISFTLIS